MESEFLNRLLQNFEATLENKGLKVNFTKNTVKSHFFGSEIVKNIANASYNPNELLKLEFSDKIKENTIRNTARYFAEHEYQHWTTEFSLFNSPEFEEPNPSEIKILKKNSHGDTYFLYDKDNLKYLFVEFLIDTSLNEDLKTRDNLFVEYNLEGLEETIISLNIKNNKSEIDDEIIRRGFNKSITSKKKILQTILARSLRLYALNQLSSVENIFNVYEIESFLEIIKSVCNKLICLSKSSLRLDTIKKKIMEIKNYLENQDYIQVFFYS